jgi:hypothetical protein
MAGEVVGMFFKVRSMGLRRMAAPMSQDKVAMVVLGAGEVPLTMIGNAA